MLYKSNVFLISSLLLCLWLVYLSPARPAIRNITHARQLPIGTEHSSLINIANFSRNMTFRWSVNKNKDRAKENDQLVDLYRLTTVTRQKSFSSKVYCSVNEQIFPLIAETESALRMYGSPQSVTLTAVQREIGQCNSAETNVRLLQIRTQFVYLSGYHHVLD